MIIAANRVRTSLVVGAAAISVIGVAWLLSDRLAEPDDVQRVEAGLLAWDRSCPTRTSNGLCLAERVREPHRKGEQPTRCGPDSYREPTIVDRAPAAQAAALGELHTAIAAYEITGGERHVYAEAKLAIADNELERYIALAFPADLNFDPAHPEITAESARRFADWLDQKRNLGRLVRERYTAIAALHDPVGSVAATSRLGLIPQNVFETLMASPIPPALRTSASAEEQIDAYCDAMTAAAEPLEQQAIADFKTCVDSARKHALATSDLQLVRAIADRARPCLDELARLQPNELPMMREVFAEPRDHAYVWELVRLHTQLGNYDRAALLLATIPTNAYDHLNAFAVVRRGEGNFRDATAAYRAAIELDPSRPEAYYNMAILLVDHVAPTTDVDQVLVLYHDAIRYLTTGASRATGPLAREIDDQLALTKRTIAQVEAFQLAMRR